MNSPSTNDLDATIAGRLTRPVPPGVLTTGSDSTRPPSGPVRGLPPNAEAADREPDDSGGAVRFHRRGPDRRSNSAGVPAQPAAAPGDSATNWRAPAGAPESSGSSPASRFFPSDEFAIRASAEPAPVPRSGPGAEPEELEPISRAGFIPSSSAADRRRHRFPVVPGFEIQAELGRGTSGVIYQARSVKLQRSVALKMIIGGDFCGPAEHERFRQEARTVAKLQHQNIVQIFEIGEFDGRPFLVLEYVPDGTLKDVVGSNPLPVTVACQLLQALARGMAHAHREGVIHRDLKPGNVLVQRRRLRNDSALGDAVLIGDQAVTPKIADFGLAKTDDYVGSQTRTGEILGTPNYMAPEQARGDLKAIGPASDVHALGAIFYEMLTGHPPFQGASAIETINLVRSTEPVPPRQVNPKVPRDLDVICIKCLQKDPGKRYPSAVDLAEDLRRYLAGETILAKPASSFERVSKWTFRNPSQAAIALLAGLAIVSLTALAGNRYFGLSSELARETELRKKEHDLRALADQRLNRIRTADGVARLHAGDPAAALLVFANASNEATQDADAERRDRIRLGALQQSLARPIATMPFAASFRRLSWSSDGKTLLLDDEAGVRKLWAVATNRIEKFEEEPGRTTLWCDFLETPRPYRITGPAEGGRRGSTYVIREHGGGFEKSWTSRIGPWVAFRVAAGGKRLVAVDGERAEVVDLTTGLVRDFELSFDPAVESLVLATAGNALAAVGPEAIRLRIGADLADADVRTGTVPARGTRRAEFDRGGKVMLAIDGEGSAKLIRSNSPGTAITARLRFSGDIRAIRFSRSSSIAAVLEAGGAVRVIDAASETPVELHRLRPTGGAQAIELSPDGRWLFVSDSGGRCLVCSSTTGEPALPPLHQGDSPIHQVAPGPDGEVAAALGADGSVRLWNLAGRREPEPLDRLPSDAWILAPRDDVPFFFALSRRGEALAVEDGAVTRHRLPGATLLDAEAADRADLVVTLDVDGVIRFWNPRKGALIAKPTTVPGARRVRLSHDGLKALALTERAVLAIDSRTGSVTELATGDFSKTRNFDGLRGDAVLTVDSDGLSRHAAGRSSRWPLPGRVRHVHVEDGSDLIAVGCEDGRLLLFNAVAEEFTPIASVRTASGVNSVGFDRDGRRAVVCSEDGQVTVRSTTGLEPLLPPLRHEHHAVAAHFSGDGRSLLTVTSDGRMHLWDALSGLPMSAPIGDGRVIDAALTASGDGIIAMARDGAMLRYRFDADLISAGVRAGRAVQLAGASFDSSLGVQPLGAGELERLGVELSLEDPGFFTISREDRIAFHAARAEEAARDGDARAALFHHDRLVAHDGDNPGRLVARALARARLQQFAPARADLEAALARDPRQPEVARLAKLLALTDRKVEPEAAASADDEEAAEHDSLALVLAALRAERANEVAEVANLMDRLQTLSRQSPTPEAGPTRIEGGHGDHWRTTADWLSALRKPLGESTVAGATLALSRLTLRDQRAAAEQVAAVKDPAKPVAWLARLRADVATRLGRTEDAIRHRKRWQELGGDSASAGQPATIPVVDREPEPTRRPTPSSPTDGGSEPSIARRAAREAHRLGEWTKAATLWRRALPTLSSEELTLAGQAAALADGNGSPDLANLVAECAAGPLTRPQATNAAPIDLERRLRAISYTGVSTTIPIPPAVAGDRESALSVALLESIGANPQAALVRLEELPSRAGERTAVERAIRVIALARTGDLEKAAREHRRLEVVRETLAADPTAEDEPGFQDDERRGLFELAKRLGARTDDSTTRERRNY